MYYSQIKSLHNFNNLTFDIKAWVKGIFLFICAFGVWVGKIPKTQKQINILLSRVYMSK